MKHTFTTILLCLSLAVWAQQHELGKVTVAELEQKGHPFDASADAAVLFEKGAVRYEYSQSEGFTMVTTIAVKIKIYKKGGYSLANKEIWYYVPSNYREKVSFSDAATYNLVDGKVVKTKLKGDGEFDEKVNKYFNNHKITMPDVKEGSIIEYEYTIKSPRIWKFRDWDFQRDIPVNYSEFVTYIPEYFVYSPTQRGFIFPKKTQERRSRSIMYAHRDESVPGGTILHKNSQQKLEFNETQTTYVAENLPAMRDESYVNNIRNYTSGIAHELAMVKYPNAPFKTFSTDWESVAKTIYNDDDFGAELQKTGYFEADVDAALSKIATREDRLVALFNLVKSKMKWNGYYGYSCEDGVKSAYKNSSGNTAEINLMLTSMLRYAQFDANPILISTRANGIALFPTISAFNSVIVGVKIDNHMILLDATEKFAMPGILPARDLNWFGRMIRKDGSSSMIELTPKSLSKETNFISGVLNTDGTISGKVRKQYTEYSAMAYRLTAGTRNTESFIENMEHTYNDIEINDYKRENALDPYLPVTETFAYRDTRSVEQISNKMYVSPLLFFTTFENPFKQETRAYPVDFTYPSEVKYMVNLEIPQGYKIESLPQPVNLSTGDDIGAFKFLISGLDNKIQITIVSTINAAIVPADYYEVIKDFYQQMINKQTEKIVLLKV